jgi:hypothetical protein
MNPFTVTAGFVGGGATSSPSCAKPPTFRTPDLFGFGGPAFRPNPVTFTAGFGGAPPLLVDPPLTER